MQHCSFHENESLWNYRYVICEEIICEEWNGLWNCWIVKLAAGVCISYVCAVSVCSLQRTCSELLYSVKLVRLGAFYSLDILLLVCSQLSSDMCRVNIFESHILISVWRSLYGHRVWCVSDRLFVVWCIHSESAKDFEYDGLFVQWFIDLPTGNQLSLSLSLDNLPTVQYH